MSKKRKLASVYGACLLLALLLAWLLLRGDRRFDRLDRLLDRIATEMNVEKRRRMSREMEKALNALPPREQEAYLIHSTARFEAQQRSASEKYMHDFFALPREEREAKLDRIVDEILKAEASAGQNDWVTGELVFDLTPAFGNSFGRDEHGKDPALEATKRSIDQTTAGHRAREDEFERMRQERLQRRREEVITNLVEVADSR